MSTDRAGTGRDRTATRWGLVADPWAHRPEHERAPKRAHTR